MKKIITLIAFLSLFFSSTPAVHAKDSYNTFGVTENPYVHTAVFTRDQYIYAKEEKVATIRFSTIVLYYSYGSFRCFEGVLSCDEILLDSICDMDLKYVTASAWSHTQKFPCTQLDYAFTGQLTTGETAISDTVTCTLENAGFTDNFGYQKIFNKEGSISLY